MKIGLINAYSTRNAGDAAIYAALEKILAGHELLALADARQHPQLAGIAIAPLDSECDAYLSVGGDIFNNARPRLITCTFLRNLRQLQRYPRRTVLFGQSIPASCRGWAFRLLCRALKNLSGVVVRDTESWQRLRQAGVDAQLSYDTAFVHRPGPVELGEALALLADRGLDATRSVLLSLREFDALYPHDNARVAAKLACLCWLLYRAGLQPALLVQSAAEGGNALTALIGDILDLTKVEAGKLELESLPVQPAAVLAEVLHLLQGRAEEKGLRLSSYLMPDLPAWVMGDPTRLRQVLLNLVGNAVKFTGQGGVAVRVALAKAPVHGLLLFDVTDTGVGIAENVQPHLFNLFTQVDPSDTRKYGGSGLGLAISKRLVELWGGRIGLESRPGEGSRFWFTFGAVCDGAALPDSPAVEEATLGAAGGASVLLVEDGPANQLVLSAMLRHGGYRVDVADGGQAAIAAVGAKHYDLVFMDVSMPDMNGMEATRRIRRLGGWAADVPIVAMTAHAVKGYRDECLAAGMNDYATKPIGKKDLRALVARWSAGRAGPIDLAPPPVEPHASVLVDASVIRQVAADAGIEDVAGLAGMFITELAQRHAAIAQAVVGQDMNSLGLESHSLKSAAATFGALPLQTLATAMDKACKQHDMPAALAAAGQLLPCAEATLAEMRRLFADCAN